MSHSDQDPNTQRDPGRTTPQRIVIASAVAAVLVAVGAAIYAAGIFNPIAQSPDRDADRGEQIARQDTERRQAWLAERKEYTADPKATPPSLPVAETGYFIPNDIADAPDNQFGDSVRRGYEIFTNTQTNASQHVGNGMNCANCHLGAGTVPGSAPMWAAAVEYPAFRGKNKIINTMEDRIHGCFTYSMNAQNSPSGSPPPRDGDIYKDLQSFFFYMAEGAPLEGNLPGRGYAVPPEPEDGYSITRGETVFENNCAVCHGTSGEGRRDPNGRWIFPALWGDDSYNWGAGMHRVNTAAGFIKHNMPLGQGGSLTDQQAWDVAAYINSWERPADPRQLRDGLTVAETDERFHEHTPNFYGDEVRGDLLGDGIPGEPTAQQPPSIGAPRHSQQASR